MNKYIATDLDRTLFPNGSWPHNDKDTILFKELVKKYNINLIYVTGRDLKLVKKGIKEYGFQIPNFLISDVGTKIWFKSGKSTLKEDLKWRDFVLNKHPNWNHKNIIKTLSKCSFLTSQEKEKNNLFKISYYIDPKNLDKINSIKQKIKQKYDGSLTYSFDPLKKIGLLDIMPKNINKSTALKYLIKKEKICLKDIVYAGDSGNDIAPLTSGIQGIVVRNADQQLKKAIKKFSKSKPKLIFCAKKTNNLSGYYVSGIILGCYNFNIFPST